MKRTSFWITAGRTECIAIIPALILHRLPSDIFDIDWMLTCNFLIWHVTLNIRRKYERYF